MKRRQEWAGRILLERTQHADASFVTLTYEDKHLTYSGAAGLPSLYPRDLTLYLKTLRHRFRTPFRYFACGEYGSDTKRPHFHVVLFGQEEVYDEHKISQTWGKGSVKLSELNTVRAKYVAKYTTKKQTSQDAYSDGRAPEFSRMSRKPGVGLTVIPKIAASLKRCGYTYSNGRLRGLTTNLTPITIPECYRYNNKLWPLDPYMKKLLKKELLNSDECLPEAVINMVTNLTADNTLEIFKETEAHLSSIQRAKNYEQRYKKSRL